MLIPCTILLCRHHGDVAGHSDGRLVAPRVAAMVRAMEDHVRHASTLQVATDCCEHARIVDTIYSHNYASVEHCVSVYHLINIPVLRRLLRQLIAR